MKNVRFSKASEIVYFPQKVVLYYFGEVVFKTIWCFGITLRHGKVMTW